MPPLDDQTLRGKALGVLEVTGLSFAVAAADAMAKTAAVDIVGQARAGGGLTSILVSGDLASVRAAVDAGANEVARLGGTASTSVLGRPEPDLARIVTMPERPAPATEPAAAEPTGFEPTATASEPTASEPPPAGAPATEAEAPAPSARRSRPAKARPAAAPAPAKRSATKQSRRGSASS